MIDLANRAFRFINSFNHLNFHMSPSENWSFKKDVDVFKSTDKVAQIVSHKDSRKYISRVSVS